MAVENRHIERISGTRSALGTNLDNLQIAVESDNSENLVYKDDDGTYHIVANQSEDVVFADITADKLTVVDGLTVEGTTVGLDVNNQLDMTATYTFLKANGSKIIDYLHANGYIAVNSDLADIDFRVYGTGAKPIAHFDAATGRLALGSINAGSQLSVVKEAGTSAIGLYCHSDTSGTTHSATLRFRRNNSDDEDTLAATADGQGLGRLDFNAISSHATPASVNTANIRVIQVGAARATGVSSKIILQTVNAADAVVDAVTVIPDGTVEVVGAVSYGGSATDGSWQTVKSGTSLLFQRRESSAWVTKMELEA